MPGSVFASAITGTIAVDSLPVVSSASAGIVPMIGTATTAYLKGDLTWSVITGGGGVLVETHIPLIQLATASTI